MFYTNKGFKTYHVGHLDIFDDELKQGIKVFSDYKSAEKEAEELHETMGWTTYVVLDKALSPRPKILQTFGINGANVRRMFNAKG